MGACFLFVFHRAGSTRRKDALKALVRLGFAEKGRRSLDVTDTSWRFWKWVYLKVSLSLRQGQSRVRSRPWTLQKQGACESNAFSSYIGHGAAHATDGGAIRKPWFCFSEIPASYRLLRQMNPFVREWDESVLAQLTLAHMELTQHEMRFVQDMSGDVSDVNSRHEYAEVKVVPVVSRHSHSCC